MFQPFAKVGRSRETTKDYLVPASVKGWVQNQAVAQMDPQAAYQLDNWFPEANGLRLRRGSKLWASGLGAGSGYSYGSVTQIASYMGGSPYGANNKLFAFAHGGVYDITSGGAAGSPMATGVPNSICINFANAGGNWLVCVGGMAAPMAWNGSAWITLAITGPPDLTALNFVWEYQGTLFFLETNTSNFWYLAPGAVQGAATKFPLGPLLNKGGALQVGGQWTMATAYGFVNLCAFISSEGEVVIYQGNNPSSASAWSLTAQFMIGRPIYNRCLLNINSDLIVLCQDGLMPLSKALQYDRPEAAREALTWNIQTAFNDAYLATPPGPVDIWFGFGWQIIGFPAQHMVVVNAPTAGGMYTQFVENTTTGAWCRYQNIQAICWCVQEDTVYFGDAYGNVWIGESGSADYVNVGSFGPATSPINGTWVSAFNDLEAPGRSKNALAVRVIFQTLTGIQPQVGVCADYFTPIPPATPTTVTPLTPIWDSSTWDAAIWTGDSGVVGPWVAALGDGYQFATTCAIAMQGAAPTQNIDVRIVASYILYEPGALLA